ncbi:secretion-regulating guanine nucleotide exchange factor isoform X2 [Hyla sarda]|uniref:secretion-regulating guanine nucleotide exchange factor isoform X2 n=1 Tax=Hyla sarda TaxID=327740 RepID=UPI0024C285C0|nr:secretion-regulating guanine nucleotide exchange factor isoform X2 [Hyla sarda]
MVTQMGRRGTSWMFQQCAAAEVTWGHTAMSDGQKTRRVLLTWGSNSYGQLGLGGSDDTQRPQQVPELGEKGPLIKSISAGGGHSAAITDSGKLYVCGQNKSGQLGLGHYDDLPMLTLCTAILHIRVTKVSCGWDFSIILTDNGQLLSCGSNAYGQLGNSQQRASSDPKLIQNVTEKIVDIAAGLRHSLAVTENGQTLQWGSGLASHARRFCQGKTILAFYTAQQPCPVPGLENVKVKQVAAGSYHSVALSAAGELHVWGSNKHGQLLHCEPFIGQPRRISCPMFSGEAIRAVWSGWSHVIAQSETGQVFTWGRSDYGQLGLGMSDTCANSQGNSKGKFKPPFCVTVLSGASQNLLSKHFRLLSPAPC